MNSYGFGIPLHTQTEAKIRDSITNIAPSWGCLNIKTAGKYLGYVIGPGWGDLAWEAPIAQFLERVKTWRSINPGMFHTMQAYKSYIVSVLSYVVQLDAPPKLIEQVEQKAVNILFPGPQGWLSKDFIQNLKTLHFPIQLPSIRRLVDRC